MKTVKFYDGCIVKDETKEYELYKVIEVQGIREEYYKLAEKKEIEEMQDVIDRLKQQLEEQRQISEINSNSIMEVYEMFFNEGEEINE